jgi:hypothetical protein
MMGTAIFQWAVHLRLRWALSYPKTITDLVSILYHYIKSRLTKYFQGLSKASELLESMLPPISLLSIQLVRNIVALGSLQYGQRQMILMST